MHHCQQIVTVHSAVTGKIHAKFASQMDFLYPLQNSLPEPLLSATEYFEAVARAVTGRMSVFDKVAMS